MSIAIIIIYIRPQRGRIIIRLTLYTHWNPLGSLFYPINKCACIQFQTFRVKSRRDYMSIATLLL